MRYTKLGLVDDDLISARVLNAIETIAENAILDLDHEHQEYLLKEDADTDYWSGDNGTEFDADTLSGSHASALMGVGASIPVGTMAFWDGAIEDIPPTWHLADGTNGTPDFRGKMPIGAGVMSLGEIAGSDAKYVTGSVTSPGHALTLTEIPSHRHLFTDWYGEARAGSYYLNRTGNQTSYANYAWTDLNPSELNTPAGAEHTHSGTWSSAYTVSIMPPWYALHIIIKVS